MIQEQSKQILSGPQVNTVVQGNCIQVLRHFRSRSVDFVLTDPPYLAHYCSRDGRRVANDGDAAWLKPAFAEIFRVLCRDSFCVSFYGWHQADKFIAAWREAGFRLAGHLTFTEAIPLNAAVSAVSPRERILARKGKSAATGPANSRRARMGVFRQQIASDTKTALRSHAADSVFLATRRLRSRPVLWLWLDTASREAPRPSLHRHRTRRTLLRSRVNPRGPARRVRLPACQLTQ